MDTEKIINYWLESSKNDLNYAKKAISFLELVKASGISVDSAFIFGSYTKGKAREDSDIDICLISSAFSNIFEDRLALMRLRREIDFAIEPHPFNPKDFIDENPLVWEIKNTGERVL